MQTAHTRALLHHGGITYLPTRDIQPNPIQPRKMFDEDSITELSRSIESFGILNPLTVRYRCGRYELVAGERRLRAARQAGLEEVPCIMLDVTMEDAGLIALIENLQRKDLNFIEEATGISRLIRMFGMSQEEAARRIGRSQSAVANKLRLLKLPGDVQESLRSHELTERHGRALLRLPDEKQQRQALEHIIARSLTVAATDEYIDSLLSQTDTEKPQAKRTFILKDVRVFLNSLTRSLDLMKQGGIDAGMKRQETEDQLILTISIPKARQPAVK